MKKGTMTQLSDAWPERRRMIDANLRKKEIPVYEIPKAFLSFMECIACD